MNIDPKIIAGAIATLIGAFILIPQSSDPNLVLWLVFISVAVSVIGGLIYLIVDSIREKHADAVERHQHAMQKWRECEDDKRSIRKDFAKTVLALFKTEDRRDYPHRPPIEDLLDSVPPEDIAQAELEATQWAMRTQKLK